MSILRRRWYEHTSPTVNQQSKEILDSAVDRMRDDLISDSAESTSKVFVPWKFYPKNAIPEPAPARHKDYIRNITFLFRRPPTLQPQIEESYGLEISEEGNVEISIYHPLGGLHGLTTFRQLFYKHSDPSETVSPYTPFVPIAIRDLPTFEHRGLNLDISRNIITPTEVMRTLEGLAMSKFNRLHLHASDAQSWPLEIPALPELAIKGSYHEDQIWSVADLHQVQNIGALRGIQVYLEIDMPGHTASVHAAYPDLIQSYNRHPWSNYSAQPCAGQLKLKNTDVLKFIDTLLHAHLPRTEPFTSLFHLGGDEVDANAYDMTPSGLAPHLQNFVDHAISKVHSHFLTPIVWEENILDYNLTLPNDTIVQAWRARTPNGRSALAEIVKRGYKALFGTGDAWYLDCGFGGWIDPDLSNPNSTIKSPYLDYCAPLSNWRHVYSYDPLADIPEDQQHLILGGEVHMWGEQTDGMDLDSKLWPRTAAAGEILWKGKGLVSEDVTRRLAEMREWLVAKRIQTGPVQVTWCLMNRGNCTQ